MGFFKKLGQSAKKFTNNVGRVAGDYGKYLAKTALAPINTLTGHNFDPKLKTKFFKKADNFTTGVYKKAASVGGGLLGVGDLNGIIGKKKKDEDLILSDDAPTETVQASFWDFLLY